MRLDSVPIRFEGVKITKLSRDAPPARVRWLLLAFRLSLHRFGSGLSLREEEEEEGGEEEVTTSAKLIPPDRPTGGRVVTSPTDQ